MREKPNQNSTDIKALQDDLKALAVFAERLAYEVRGNKDAEAYERTTMALRLEVELLKFERRLPAPG